MGMYLLLNLAHLHQREVLLINMYSNNPLKVRLHVFILTIKIELNEISLLHQGLQPDNT